MIEGSPTAPPQVRWCSRCRGAMVTREIAGRPRRTCPGCGHIHFVEPKVGVGVSVVQDGALLLVRRRFAPHKGKWSIPAGYLDVGEDPQRKALEEVLEETGLEVALDGLVGVFHNAPEEGGAGVFILYRGRRLGGELRAGDDADDARFFSPPDLPDIAFASTRHAVAMLGRK